MTTDTTPRQPVGVAGAAIPGRTQPRTSLPTYRVNLMRVGYAVMAFGLAATKWPLLPAAADLPVFEGVVAVLLTAMSLLALVGLRYPVRLLPLLILEAGWKLIWLAAVAVPQAVAGTLTSESSRVLSSVSLVVVILAVIPWDHVWRTYVRAPGDAWRRAPAEARP